MAAMIPHTNLDFTTPDDCRGSELVQAIQQLAAAHTRGAVKIRIRRRPPLKHVVVDYEPHPEVVRITGYCRGAPAVQLGMQFENGLNPWPVNIAWPDGEVAVRLDFSSRTIWFEDSSCVDEPRVVYPKRGPWKRIEGRGGAPDDVLRVVRAISDEITLGPRGRCGTAANCARYANKVLAAGFLCALSFGGDTESCQESHDAHCQWCECKGYNCPSCH
jgi:hypothetical protein